MGAQPVSVDFIWLKIKSVKKWLMAAWDTSEENASIVWIITSWKESNAQSKDVFNTKATLAKFAGTNMKKLEMAAALKIVMTGSTTNA